MVASLLTPSCFARAVLNAPFCRMRIALSTPFWPAAEPLPRPYWVISTLGAAQADLVYAENSAGCCSAPAPPMRQARR
jgi:hypothetical protein